MTSGALLPVYRELLALHVISVILWMAGMIMLPVIYAKHVTTTPELARDAGFVELERSIIKRFVNPAMYAAWGFGILLIATPGTISWSAGGGGGRVYCRARVVGLSRRAILLASWSAGRHRSPRRLLLWHGDGHPDRIGHADRDDGDHSALIRSRSTLHSTIALLRSASCAANSSVTGPARHRRASSASGSGLAVSSAR